MHVPALYSPLSPNYPPWMVVRQRKRAEQAEAALEIEKLDREEFEALVQEELQRLQDEKQRSEDSKHQSDARIEEMRISLQQYCQSLRQHQESLRLRDASIVEVCLVCHVSKRDLLLEEKRPIIRRFPACGLVRGPECGSHLSLSPSFSISLFSHTCAARRSVHATHYRVLAGVGG